MYGCLSVITHMNVHEKDYKLVLFVDAYHEKKIHFSFSLINELSYV